MSVTFVREVIIGAGTRLLTEAWRPDATTCSNRDACTPLTILQSALKVSTLLSQGFRHSAIAALLFLSNWRRVSKWKFRGHV